MGHSNGLLEKPSRREKVKIGIGLKSTPDNHFDLQNKRLTNISAPMDDHDAVTKRFVADLLRAALYKYQLSSLGREKMKFLKLSQMNGLDK